MIPVLFGTDGKIVRTGHHHRSKTLLVGMAAALTEIVVRL